MGGVKIVVPYSDIDLRIALVGLGLRFDEKKADKKKSKFMAEIDKIDFPNSKKELNASVANHNGISIGQLISSLNYEALCNEYMQTKIKEAIKLFVGIYGVTEKEAWAGLALSLGLIEV